MDARLLGSGATDDPIRLDLADYDQAVIRDDGSIEVAVPGVGYLRAVADGGRAARLANVRAGGARLDERIDLTEKRG